MKVSVKFKQLFCNHKYLPWANIHGDLINDYDGCRTVLLCPKCSKRKFIKKYIEAPLNYNSIEYMMYLSSIMDKEAAYEQCKDSIIKDEKLWYEIFQKEEVKI